MRKPRARGNGDGSLYCVFGRRMPWAAVVTVGWTPSGKPVRRARYAKTRAEAEALLELMSSGVMPPPALKKRLVPEGAIKGKRPRSRHSRALSPRQRFLVLQRDGFACVYCGRRPPEVELHVDHRIAYTNDGANDPANYATACADCNLGKSDLPVGE